MAAWQAGAEAEHMARKDTEGSSGIDSLNEAHTGQPAIVTSARGWESEPPGGRYPMPSQPNRPMAPVSQKSKIVQT